MFLQFFYVILSPWANVINPFLSVNYEFCNKLKCLFLPLSLQLRSDRTQMKHLSGVYL
jgi:hypothetical protein